MSVILVFGALGVPASPFVLLTGYGLATALALFGVSAEAATPILGYHLFNLSLPIPLAAVFYPTFRPNGGWLEQELAL